VNTVIWIAHAVLAVAMLGAGTMKLTQSKDKLPAAAAARRPAAVRCS
jgi:hypothetical protein